MRLRPHALRVVCSLAFLASAAGGQNISAVSSSLKIRPSDPVAMQSAITLHAARNEFEAFQIAILGGTSGFAGVTVNTTSLTLVGGTATIPASELRVYHEATLTLSNQSSLDGAPGQWRDPLVPAQDDGVAAFKDATQTWQLKVATGEARTSAVGFPISVAPNTNEVVWVDIHVPKGQPTGSYQGAVTVLAGGTQIGSIALTVVVRNFELSSTSSLRTFFSASAGQMCIAHGDVAAGGCPNATEVHLWNRLYGHLFLDHRVTISLSDHAPTTGHYAGDYGAFLSGTEFPSGQRLQGATPTTIVFPWWNPQDTQSTFTTNLSNWKSMLAGNSWPGFSFHYAKFWAFDSSGNVLIMDEPHSNPADWNSPGFIVDQGTWAHALDPNFPVLVTANATNYANATSSSPAVNILSPLVDEMDVKVASTLLYQGNHRPDYNALLSAKMGNQLWMYQSCDSHGCGNNSDPNAKNYPNVMVDASAVQNRAEPWMHFIYGNTGGMLYYDVAARLASAWDPDGIFLSGGNGDGTLAYPGTPAPVPGGSSMGIGGTTHIPLASIRLKMIREGLEDYEYLLMCNSANPTTAMNIATTLFAMVGTTGSNGFPFGSMYHANDAQGTITPAQFAVNLEAAREQLASCILGSVCNPNTCDGCCDETGSCVHLANENNNTCGNGAAACHPCSSGQTCSTTGSCVTTACSKSNCGGCCDANNQCHTLGDQNYCGDPGGACDDCDQQGVDSHCIQINSCTGNWGCMDTTCQAGKPPHCFPACP